MPDMDWKTAIIKVLSDSEGALHYSDIASKILEDQLLTSVGATPAATVSSVITRSLKEDGSQCPFVRVSRGFYGLREKMERYQFQSNGVTQPGRENTEMVETESSIIHAFGMFWERELVFWRRSPPVHLKGRQHIGADVVDFSEQKGVYLLHDRREVVYVGRSIDRSLAIRLYEHTQDRLRGRWNRFSWFGLLRVAESGQLQQVDIKPSTSTIIATLEALLIEALEPPQNRKRGDDFGAIEFLQVEDPEIRKQQKKNLLDELANSIGKNG